MKIQSAMLHAPIMIVGTRTEQRMTVGAKGIEALSWDAQESALFIRTDKGKVLMTPISNVKWAIPAKREKKDGGGK